MGEMFRSDHMTQCDVYLQPEVAYEILSDLGELGMVQFSDMNPDLSAFQRNYVNEVTRCAEMERKLRYLESEVKGEDIEIIDLVKEPPVPPVGEMIIYEGIIDQWKIEIEEMTTNQKNIKKSYTELNEMYYVLNELGPILGDTDERRESMLRVGRQLGEGGHLAIISGVVKRAKSFIFEIMLWRVSHGNVYYRQAPKDEILEDPQTGQEVRKVAFLAACQGTNLENKIRKVCNGFRANLYPCPYSFDEREETTIRLSDRLQDLDQVIKKTSIVRKKALRAVSKQLMHWKISVKKMKAVYHNLNLFNVDVTKKVLIGQCWVPTRYLPNVRNILENCCECSRSQLTSFLSKVQTDEIPPTFNQTNKFTKAFQKLIDSYGDATYGEVNPALYTIITFPFLFALMFGDVGHALIMTIFSVWMITYETELEPSAKKNEVWGIFFAGRYILLLMGLFSMYTGIIYNDLFSKGMNLFGSHWRNTFDNETMSTNHLLTLDPKTATTSSLYIIGIDPAWLVSSNRILFENSLKMKFSIIIGVIHMMFGVILSTINYCYFKRVSSIFLEFLPQFLFLTLIFFYLVFMIFFKWFNYSGEFLETQYHAGCAPLVLILFIDMALFSESKVEDPKCEPYMFENQMLIQRTLVILALCCIPVMLFGRPCYLRYKRYLRNRPKKPTGSQFRRYRRDSRRHSDRKSSIVLQLEEKNSFGEMMIHQGVNTIEYVLSTISHTASYLRLWALSLAHCQLSEMLWVMVLSKNGLRKYTPVGVIFLVPAFAIWAIFTIAILVVMEGLSAFLHTLRLHWVEFMSKFYMGTGYPFRPFSFTDILRTDDKEEKQQKVKT